MIVCLGAGAKHRGRGRTLSSTNDSRRPPLDPIQAAEALRWWVRAGVNEALDETPHDRFAEEPAPRSERAGNGERTPDAPRR